MPKLLFLTVEHARANWRMKCTDERRGDFTVDFVTSVLMRMELFVIGIYDFVYICLTPILLIYYILLCYY